MVHSFVRESTILQHIGRVKKKTAWSVAVFFGAGKDNAGM
jgi:hypothetical protein